MSILSLWSDFLAYPASRWCDLETPARGPTPPISPSLEFLGAASGSCQNEASGPPLPGQCSGACVCSCSRCPPWDGAIVGVRVRPAGTLHVRCPSPGPCLPAPGLLYFSYQTLKRTQLGTGKTVCLPLESSRPRGGLVCAASGSRGQAQGLQGQGPGARVPVCLRAAQAWLMALSPMPGQLSACFQIKNAYSLEFQVSDPRKNSKPPTQIRKLRPCGAWRDQG